METIAYVEGSVFFLNKGGNPLDYSSVLRRLHTIITDGSYRESDPEFTYYLDRISEDMLISAGGRIGPDPLEHLPDVLEEEIDNETDFSDDDFYRYSLYVLGGLYTRMYNFEEGRSLLHEYSDEFEDDPYFGMTKAIILEGSGEVDDLDCALETAWEYRSEYPRYSKIQMLLAKVIASSLEQDHVYQGENEEIPKNRENLIQIANEAASLAVSTGNHPPNYEMTKGRVEALQENFDSAKEHITKAISSLSRERTRYSELRSEFGRELTRIKIQQQQSELSNQTSKIGSQVSDIKDNVDSASTKIDELKSELEDTVVDFRRNVLEFLGFFSAIIASIVITGQIALTISNVDKAAQLIMVSYGGLLFAFGGFTVLLASDAETRRDRVLMMVIGLLVVSLSIFGDSIVGIFTELNPLTL